MASSIAIAASSSMVADAAAPALAPARRKRRKYRCGCVTREGCHVCGGCVERHCSCGERDRRDDRKLCLESRACNCIKLSPASSCPLCHGCRQPRGQYSHCRCVQHQQQRKLSQAQLDAAIEDGSHVKYCSCIAFPRKKPAALVHGSINSHRDYGVAGQEDTEQERKPKLQTRIRRIRRAAGVPTASSIYDRKITTSFSDPEDSDQETQDDVGLATAAGQEQEGLQSDAVLPKLMIRKQFRDVFPPPYQPLLLDKATSMLESLEPANGPMRTATRRNMKVNRQVLIERGLENYIYALDQEDNKPSGDLVDYLIYLASLKVSNVPELVGTMDDTAAVATAIVMEEYMAQLVLDFAEQQQPLCAITQASVQAFAHQLLLGFNWKLYQNQCGGVENDVDPSDAFALEQADLDSLASMIYQELLATQNGEAQVLSDLMEIQATQWIREVVSQQYEASVKPNTLGQLNDDELDHDSSKPSPFVRLGVHGSALAGTPVYNFSLEAQVAGGQRVAVSVDGIETRELALERIQRIKNSLAQAQSQHEELMKQHGRQHLVNSEPEESKHQDDDLENLFEDPAVESLYRSLSSGIVKYLTLRGEYEVVQTARQLEKQRAREELARQKREKIERMRMEWAEKQQFEPERKKAIRLVEKKLKVEHSDYLARRRLQIIKLCQDRELILSEEIDKADDTLNGGDANTARIKELHLLQEKRLLLEDDIEKEKREKELTEERYESWRKQGRPLKNPKEPLDKQTLEKREAMRLKRLQYYEARQAKSAKDAEEQKVKVLKRKQREEAKQAKSATITEKKQAKVVKKKQREEASQAKGAKALQEQETKELKRKQREEASQAKSAAAEVKELKRKQREKSRQANSGASMREQESKDARKKHRDEARQPKRATATEQQQTTELKTKKREKARQSKSVTTVEEQQSTGLERIQQKQARPAKSAKAMKEQEAMVLKRKQREEVIQAESIKTPTKKRRLDKLPKQTGTPEPTIQTRSMRNKTPQPVIELTTDQSES